MGLFSSMKDAGKKMYKGYDNIKVNRAFTVDELFEVVKEGTYPIGAPEISGTGIMRSIRFPAMGKYQIFVVAAKNKVCVQKSYSGAGGLAKEALGDALTNGWYTGINKENLDGNEMVEEISKEIVRLMTEKGYIA